MPTITAKHGDIKTWDDTLKQEVWSPPSGATSHAKADMLALSGPTPGQVVRVTDAERGLWRFNGDRWVKVEPWVDTADFGVFDDSSPQSTAGLKLALEAARDSADVKTVLCTVGQFKYTSGDWTVYNGCALLGIQSGPQAHTAFHDAGVEPSPLDYHGTTFQVTAGEGTTSGYFGRVFGNAVVEGITFFYPNQDRTLTTPKQYPPTLFLGESSSNTHFDQTVRNCEFIGGWTAVRQRYGGRFRLENLQGYCVNALDLDKSYDVAWVVDCIFNSFFYSSTVTAAPGNNYYIYTNQNGVGLKVGRTDQLIVKDSYFLGYKYGLETWESAAEGSLPGGSPWMDVEGGGLENCLAAARIGQAQAGHGITLRGVRTVAAHDASGGGGAQGIVIGPSHTGLVRIVSGHFGMGSNTENNNLLILGGGQIQVGAEAYFFNAIGNNIRVESPSGTPCNLQIHGSTFNTSGSHSIAIPGYCSGSVEASSFIQKNRADAISYSGLGGFSFPANACRFLDVIGTMGDTAAPTRWYQGGAVGFSSNVEILDPSNITGSLELQSIGGGPNVGFGCVSVNAILDRGAGAWNRVNPTAGAWLWQAKAAADGSSNFSYFYVPPGANPIGVGWTPLLSLKENGAFGLDSGTATAAAGAATLDKVSGTITTEGLTTAAGALYNLTLTNSLVATTSRAFASVSNGTNTSGFPCVLTVTKLAGSMIVTVMNLHPTDAFNGTLEIDFWVLN